MINIIGLGYIGLPTALMFASNGIKVIGTDINEKIVENLNNGIVDIDEQLLEELFTDAKHNDIEFSTKVFSTDTYVITVPTPYDDNTKKIDSKYIIDALNEILKVCKDDTVVIVESTISPGTIDKFIRPIIDKFMNESNKNIHIAHAPERIIPGNMVYELKHNSRTIGADNKLIANRVKDLYKSFCQSEIVLTDIKSAEMSKVVENTFRDINIAFANELAKLCRTDNMDVYEIIKIANMHPRVNILQPGPGVGGHCIPVDPWFLVGDYPSETTLIKTAREVNNDMPQYVLDRINSIMEENSMIDFSKVGLYGISYKENIGDIRESPTLQLLSKMSFDDASKVAIYDPFVTQKVSSNQYFNIDDFMENVDLLVIMVGHNQILLRSLDSKITYDTRNIVANSDYKI